MEYLGAGAGEELFTILKITSWGKSENSIVKEDLPSLLFLQVEGDGIPLLLLIQFIRSQILGDKTGGTINQIGNAFHSGTGGLGLDSTTVVFTSPKLRRVGRVMRFPDYKPGFFRKDLEAFQTVKKYMAGCIQLVPINPIVMPGIRADRGYFDNTPSAAGEEFVCVLEGFDVIRDVFKGMIKQDDIPFPVQLCKVLF